MEGLDLEFAKRIDRPTRRIGGQRGHKLSGDRDIELPEYLDAHDEPVSFFPQEVSCASLNWLIRGAEPIGFQLSEDGEMAL